MRANLTLGGDLSAGYCKREKRIAENADFPGFLANFAPRDGRAKSPYHANLLVNQPWCTGSDHEAWALATASNDQASYAKHKPFATLNQRLDPHPRSKVRYRHVTCSVYSGLASPD